MLRALFGKPTTIYVSLRRTYVAWTAKNERRFSAAVWDRSGFARIHITSWLGFFVYQSKRYMQAYLLYVFDLGGE